MARMPTNSYGRTPDEQDAYDANRWYARLIRLIGRTGQRFIRRLMPQWALDEMAFKRVDQRAAARIAAERADPMRYTPAMDSRIPSHANCRSAAIPTVLSRSFLPMPCNSALGHEWDYERDVANMTNLRACTLCDEREKNYERWPDWYPMDMSYAAIRDLNEQRFSSAVELNPPSQGTGARPPSVTWVEPHSNRLVQPGAAVPGRRKLNLE